MMEREGVYWDKADNTRLAGKAQLHRRLAFDEKGIPMLYVFSTCRHFIRTVPSLIYSQINVEDVDTMGEDHIYDECRYICMENPLAPRRDIHMHLRAEDDPLAFTPYKQSMMKGR